MKYFAVIDTNVVVSAFLKSNSIPDTLLDLALAGVIVPLLNDEIVTEYKDVLSRDKFAFGDELVNDFIKQIQNVGLYINAEKSDIELPDTKDIVFYEVVMEKRKTDDAYLVTGNIKHFTGEAFIVTPREMLEIIAKDY
ncbi:MAG: putative toxin-antitoxin system toxin component, PIN family [Clostridiales bacterium]|nr:putative toxin-antitoxin system toxin component, PIN family [Clostridiales bacterium]